MNGDRDRIRELVDVFEGSTSLQVGAIMGLFGPGNVEELILAMPDAFRADFLSWCFKLRQGGPPLGDWTPEFAHGFEAVCRWMDEQLAAELAKDMNADVESTLTDALRFEDVTLPKGSHDPPRKAA